MNEREGMELRREDEELIKIDSELRLYVQYLKDQVRLNAKMNEIQYILHHGDTYGISSPRIKNIEEAKYQTSPRVYLEDDVLSRMIKKDVQIDYLEVLHTEFTMKRIFCYRIQERICAADLSEKEIQIMYLRYFRGMSLRNIASEMWSNKDNIAKKLSETLRKI